LKIKEETKKGKVQPPSPVWARSIWGAKKEKGGQMRKNKTSQTQTSKAENTRTACVLGTTKNTGGDSKQSREACQEGKAKENNKRKGGGKGLMELLKAALSVADIG